MINLNPPKSPKQLQEFIQAVNYRPSGVPKAGCAYQRFHGRTPLLHLTQLPHTLSEQQKDSMRKQMELHREKYRCNFILTPVFFSMEFHLLSHTVFLLF